jgi:hypothetical protein
MGLFSKPSSSLRPISLDDMRQPDPRRSGAVPPAGETASRRGYKFVGSGFPCPIPGSEAGVVFFDLPDGRRALWDGGEVYARESS